MRGRVRERVAADFYSHDIGPFSLSSARCFGRKQQQDSSLRMRRGLIEKRRQIAPLEKFSPAGCTPLPQGA